jgi:hypothetical protein
MLAVASRLVSGNLGLITVARKPRDSAAGSSLRSARWLRCSEPGRRIGCYPTGSRWASPRARPRSAARTAPPAPRSSGPPFIPGQRRLACQRALLAVPIAGGRSDQPAHDDPTMMPAAISRAPTAPALPRGKHSGASCGARRCGRRSLGPPWGPGHRLSFCGPDATVAAGPPQQPAANSGDRHLGNGRVGSWRGPGFE